MSERRRRWLRVAGHRLLTRNAALFVLVFVTAVLVWQNIRIQDESDRRALYNWQQCQRARVNTQKINSTNRAFQDFLAQFVPTSQNPEQLNEFIAIYQRAELTVPDCGARP